MNPNRLVSIIVPAYNASSTLARCVDSLVGQSYPDIEIILVDDGSTDSTPDLCNKFASSLRNCTTIHQCNGGLSSARNAGLRIAHGQYVYFIDSDDHLSSETIAALVASLTRCEADMAVGGIQWVSDEGKIISIDCADETMLDEEGYWRAALGIDRTKGKTEYIISCGKLFHRKLFASESFDEGKIHEDEFIIHRLVRQCERIAMVGMAGYHYVKSSESITGSETPKSLLDASEALLLRTDYLLSRGWNYLAWRALSLACEPLAKARFMPPARKENSRFNALLKRWRTFYRRCIVCTEKSARSLVLCSLFRLSPSVYSLLRKKMSNHG